MYQSRTKLRTAQSSFNLYTFNKDPNDGYNNVLTDRHKMAIATKKIREEEEYVT